MSPELLAVFHIALMVAAAIQIRETKTALVTMGDCDGSVNYAVSNCCALWWWCIIYHLCAFLELWRKRYTFPTCWTFPYCCALCHCCILVRHDFLDQTVVRRIWVSCSVISCSASFIYQVSWAIFHVVGANPKMKSRIFSINMLPIVLLIIYSYVPMVSDHDLPVEVWLLFLHWSDDPGLSLEFLP